MTTIDEKYNALSDKDKKKVQELRKRMANDLGIDVKSKIPLDLYIEIANSKVMSTIEVEGNEFTITFTMKGRAQTILDIIDPTWRNSFL